MAAVTYPAERGTPAVMEREGFVRVKQAAQILGVSPNMIRAWGAAGKLPEYRHPVNNYRLFKRADLETVLTKLAGSVVAKELDPGKGGRRRR